MAMVFLAIFLPTSPPTRRSPSDDLKRLLTRVQELRAAGFHRQAGS
jgi:hypothetical protein